MTQTAEQTETVYDLIDNVWRNGLGVQAGHPEEHAGARERLVAYVDALQAKYDAVVEFVCAKNTEVRPSARSRGSVIMVNGPDDYGICESSGEAALEKMLTHLADVRARDAAYVASLLTREATPATSEDLQ